MRNVRLPMALYYNLYYILFALKASKGRIGSDVSILRRFSLRNKIIFFKGSKRKASDSFELFPSSGYGLTLFITSTVSLMTDYRNLLNNSGGCVNPNSNLQNIYKDVTLNLYVSFSKNRVKFGK